MKEKTIQFLKKAAGIFVGVAMLGATLTGALV